MQINFDNLHVEYSFLFVSNVNSTRYIAQIMKANSNLLAPNIPFGYNACIRGFVEELVVDDDPEYAWIDKIRRASASNEARQVAFLKLAGQVIKKITIQRLSLIHILIYRSKERLA